MSKEFIFLPDMNFQKIRLFLMDLLSENNFNRTSVQQENETVPSGESMFHWNKTT